MASFAIRLRPVVAEDEPFLIDLYRSTRERELAQVDWAAAQLLAFVRSQFAAQQTHYCTFYPHADFQVIELDGRAVGRLYVERNAEEIRIIDIALLPAERGRGIGGELVRGLLAEADQSRRPMRIHVEPENPALAWYRRLGFRELRPEGFYLFMEYEPK